MHIDWWTLALQTANVLVLIWILARFFFRPVADIIARRQDQANKLLADAAATRQAAADARAEVDKAHALIDAERNRLIAEAKESAQFEKASILAQATQEISKLRDDADSAIAADRTAAQEAVIARASELSVQIAERLLARLPSQIGLSAFLDGLCQELRALPSEVMAGLTAEKPGDAAIEVVTVATLSKAEIAQVSAALKDALGSEMPITFRADPGVAAGIEFRSRNIIVCNSWRADLERIRKELTRAEHSRET
jgi:F-type H+-transporting ATPase subunit b